MASASDYNAAIIQEFRATGGHPGGQWAGTPMILIHHIGAKSGIEQMGWLPASSATACPAAGQASGFPAVRFAARAGIPAIARGTTYRVRSA